MATVFSILLLVMQLFGNSAYSAPPEEAARVIYITDLEGNVNRWNEFIDASVGLYRESGKLKLKNNYIFVYGGDVIDRSPGTLSILKDLVQLKKDFSKKVHLIAGNRDLNKLTFLPVFNFQNRMSDEELILAVQKKLNSINASEGLRFRLEELKKLNRDATELDAAKSLVSDIGPDGILRKYLILSELGAVVDHTLYVHGGVTEKNFLVSPGSRVRESFSSVNQWVDALNQYKDVLLAKSFKGDRDALSILFQYIVAEEGVISARYSSGMNPNPRAPQASFSKQLLDLEIERVVSGHTPYGETPVFMESGGVDYIVADNSAAPAVGATVLTLTRENAHSKTRVEEDQSLEVDFEKNGHGLVGKITANDYLIKGILNDGRVALFKVKPGFNSVTYYLKGINSDTQAFTEPEILVSVPDIERILNISDDRQRVSKLKELPGKKLNAEMIALLAAQGLKTQNTFELSELVRIASESSAIAWLPMLDKVIGMVEGGTERWMEYLFYGASGARAMIQKDCNELMDRKKD